MRKHAIAGLLLAAVLGLTTACGGSGGSGGGHDDMDMGNGSGSNGGEEQSEHGGMDMGNGSAGEMVMEDGEYSDEMFIDMMVPHHRGAIEEAEVALENAEHDELKQLSRDIISAQESEIEELKDIKEEEYGTREIPDGMSSSDMEGMGMMEDPQELADKDPFDRAFIENMIPHHEAAIEMAEVAREESNTPRITEMADAIVEAQTEEIDQMQSWRDEWYPQG